MNKRKFMAFVLSMVLVIATVSTGRASVKAATTTEVLISVTATVPNDTSNYNLDIHQMEVGGAPVYGDGGNVVNFSYTDPIKSTPVNKDGSCGKLQLILATAGKTVTSVKINGTSLNTTDITSLTSTGYMIDVTDLSGFPQTAGTPTVAVEVTIANVAPGGPTPPAGPTKPVTVNVTDGIDLLDGPVMVDGRNVTDGSVNVGDNSDDREIEFQVAFGKAVSKIIVNGTEYSGSAIKDLGNDKISVVAPDAASYNIQLKAGESKNVTIAWAYDKEEAIKFFGGEDAYVENGTVEVVSIKRGADVIYDSANPPQFDPANPGPQMSVDETGGYLPIEKGDDVVLKLIPKYGYQLSSVTINGQTLVPQEGVSTFKLDNIQGNLHFSGVFVKTDDKVDNKSESVSDVKIVSGAGVVSSGNLSLSVADNKTYDKDVTSVVEGDAEKVASVEFTLDNIVSKGNGSYWDTNLTELNKPVALSVDVKGELAEGEEYSVVRDHNGKLEELECEYDAKTGAVTFETDRFSTYTIVKKLTLDGNNNSGNSNGGNNSNRPNNNTNTNATPSTGDPYDARVVALFMIACAGLFIIGAKKKIER